MTLDHPDIILDLGDVTNNQRLRPIVLNLFDLFLHLINAVAYRGLLVVGDHVGVAFGGGGFGDGEAAFEVVLHHGGRLAGAFDVLDVAVDEVF